MFNLKKVSFMVASALYIGSSAASAVNVASEQWVAPSSDYAPKPMIEESHWSGDVAKTVKKQGKIFRAEEGVHGAHTYIVELEDAPLSAYDGQINGLAETKSIVASARLQQGTPLNLKTQELSGYTQYLTNQRQNFVAQASALQGLSVNVERAYSVAINAFTTTMSQDEAMRLAKVPGVKRITRSKVYPLSTFNTIEQTGAKQVWANAFGGGSNKGEGMVVGVIDTGINTDHPSFAEVGGDGYVHTNPYGTEFLGDCAKAEFSDKCNNKLVGVYSYPEITDSFSDPVFDESRPAFGEDYHSHGSHVAGTAAGNILYDVPFKLTQSEPQSTGLETDLVFEEVSGMAPHANIISYQVCWAGGGGDPYAGCPTTTILAAIEQSIVDNVDVLNASLGGLEEDPWIDPIEQAFFNAANAGVFVAVAAGNSGPELTTADHSSPWVTTVAAHTPSSVVNYGMKTLEGLSGGDTPAPGPFDGFSLTFDDVSGVIVNAENFSNPNAPSYAVADCDAPFPAGTFDLADDPATADIDESAEDVIVVCRRSSRPLYFKAENVAAGGAEGLIIYNRHSFQDRSAIPVIPHPLPTIHITNADGMELLDWMGSGTGHMGTITGAKSVIEPVDKERVAWFSSRGPSYFGIDTLMVDIAAPGVDIYAPSSDDQPFTNNPRTADWQTMSGTSMASPHVAGAAALLQQSHPEWSIAQVQSAMMLTAGNELSNARFFNNYADDGFLSGLQDMGAGRMRVELADKAGLTLDQSIADMADANPSAGGRTKDLNTAYAVDNTCAQTCTFVREFTATEDASWTVHTEEWIGNFELTAEPAQFDIKAGETQQVVITATSKQNSSAVEFTDLTGNQGQVTLVSSNSNSPVLELPVWTFSGDRGLPDYVRIDAHRTSAELEVGPFNTAEITDFTSRSFGMVKGNAKTVKLFSDTTAGDPFDLHEEDGEMVNINHVEWTTVPEGAKMYSASMLGDGPVKRAIMFMGQDVNQDGLPSMDEVLCMSTNYNISNFCNIVEPNAGEYFTVIMNTEYIPWGEEDMGRDISFATGVVMNDVGGLMVTAEQQQVAGYEQYNLNLAYNLPEMEIGDIYFGGFDLASNGTDLGNLGFVPVIINQVDDDVTFSIDKNKASAGDLVSFTVDVIANNEAQARNFALSTEFPEGIQIIPDSVTTTASTPVAPEVADNVLSLVGVQETTKDVERNYIVTTNVTDQSCSLTAANSPYPDYLNLRDLGWRTLEGVEGRYYNEFHFTFKELMNTDMDVSFPFFNKYHFDSIKLNPAGLVTFGDQGRTTPFHVEFPRAASFPPPPPYMIAPFWVGDNTIPQRIDASSRVPGDPNAGITPTYTYSRDWLVLEWDNVERAYSQGQNIDFEMFMRMSINYEPGEYEMLFAYDNVSLVDEQGSIGFKAADGRILVNGDMPMDINLGDSVGYNNMDEVVKDGLVVCMDYTGPEISKFSVSFDAYVSEKAANQVHTLYLNNGLEGSETERLSVDLEVHGNLTVLELSDMTVAENETISFDVVYADENAVSNVITVSGDNFTSEISGHESGSTVTLTPTAHFHGETEVTVTVHDSVNSSDMSSTSFLLMVESDGEELGCTDASATNYDASANTDDGSCTYPVEVTPPEKAKSSGGSMAWMLLLFMPLALLRRARNG
ncbi:S8 family serine peptidase [Pseudoalteromonas sp. BDTF-M6]|uniref:S8 family serine peptidase n=1 Tax=Pseudoalteromonas sp. BDTF-M6 TaxID=2796132 RepID=UPI001BAEB90D|nr:S8 family serine peptidase [Pseudoalteromonas sp. BDTF-M6]MBS3797021.1 S8 family serine peptidase [Pseudoalteromonas sp. BDTF-M6]